MKLNQIFVWLFLASPVYVSAQALQVNNLRCESKSNPMGVQQAAPPLSWQMASAQKGVLQTACRVLVADDLQDITNANGNVWDSGKINTDNSTLFVYAGKPLLPATNYYWKVMVWDNKGNASAWSETATWQTGLFTVADWKGAQWIAFNKLDSAKAGFGQKGGPFNDTLPIFRKSFIVSKPIKCATAFICGLGQFEASINGNKLGDDFLDPAWTDFKKEATYVPFDITTQVKQGANAIGVMLGNGFYYTPAGRYRKLKSLYGYPEMICRIKIQYADGSVQDVVSDDSWRTSAGPVTFSSIYGGEDFNANMVQQGWDTPAFNDNGWRKPLIIDGPPQLNAQLANPIKVMGSFKPVKITQPKPGVWVYDMGQNASGIPQITVKGARGASVKITPAELITDSGIVTQQATGKSNYEVYTLKGGDAETWHPQFTYYGFRYIQIEGAVPAGQANPDNLPLMMDVKTLHIRNSAATVGSFTCSNDLFNRTFTLIDWAIKSNMMSLLTDCPHREKLGWMEQDHLMANSIRYNFDVRNLFAQEIRDIKDAQLPNGMIPEIAPEYTVFGGGFRDSPEWGSTGVILPWYAYQWYGDKGVLLDNYAMMKAYTAYLQSKAVDNIDDFGLGDWYDIGPNKPGFAQLTPKALTATAYYYYDLTIVAKAAAILGKTTEAMQFEKQAAIVKASYNQKFFNPQTAQYATGSQTANAISVYMGLVDAQYKAAVVDNIVRDVRAHDNGITAGDIGFRYLLRVLANQGRSDVIFDMNSKADKPGYGYQLAHGATSLTESWQGYRSVSNNHLMLGHLMEWFYNDLAGIRQSDAALASKQIIVHPEPVGDVTFAKASYNCNYGTIASDWKISPAGFMLKVSIPANTTAIIELPAKAKAIITEGGKAINTLSYLKYLGLENGRARVWVGSGDYSFLVK